MLVTWHAKSLRVSCFFESVRCAMAVNVTVTPEQAALLLPILQQVTSGTSAVSPLGQGDGGSTSSQGPSPSFVPPTRPLMWRRLSSPPPTSESDTSESSGSYTRYQLLHRKKNTASSEAQNYLDVSSSLWFQFVEIIVTSFKCHWSLHACQSYCSSTAQIMLFF